MTTDELKKEAEESFEKYRVTDIDYVVSPYSEDEGEKNLMFNNEYDAEEEYYRLYFNGYIAGAEPREKRIAELEEAKANLEYLLEGRDNEIDALKKENKNLAQNLEDTEICENGWKNRVKELEAQIEKMNELINRYYEVCVQIPKEYRTMVFDSCLEDTRQLRR